MGLSVHRRLVLAARLPAVALATAILACCDSRPTSPTAPTPPTPPVTSLTPIAESIEWPSSQPSEQGLDAARLVDLLNRIRTGQSGAINSLLVARRERLVMEEYFNGWNASRVHTQQSVSKSVTSLAAGLAIDRGRMRLTDRVLPLFPDYEPIAAIDVHKQALTAAIC